MAEPSSPDGPSGDLANLESVRARIRAACARSGRAIDEVTLVAVSKTWPADRVVGLLGAGQRVFGENRVQEGQAKIPLVDPAARWHLIGALQRNKARHAVGLFELLHGVDGESLARELDKRAAAAGVRQRLLVQVNLSAESSKSGAAPADVEPLLRTSFGLGHLEPRGLMTIPPPAEHHAESRRWFAALRELRDACERRLGRALPELSMGMSGDFEIAIEEGATLIRVGTAIFGRRPAAEPRA